MFCNVLKIIVVLISDNFSNPYLCGFNDSVTKPKKIIKKNHYYVFIFSSWTSYTKKSWDLYLKLLYSFRKMNKDISEHFNFKKRQLTSQSEYEDDLKNNKMIAQLHGVSYLKNFWGLCRFPNWRKYKISQLWQVRNLTTAKLSLLFVNKQGKLCVSLGRETCFERKKGKNESIFMETLKMYW